MPAPVAPPPTTWRRVLLDARCIVYIIVSTIVYGVSIITIIIVVRIVMIIIIITFPLHDVSSKGIVA